MNLLLAYLSLIIFNNTPNCNSSPSPIRTSDSSAIVLYVFTGSDWCANCKRLEKKVLSDSSFLNKMAENNIHMELLDFPQNKKLARETIQYNTELSEKFGFQGTFPTLVLSLRNSNKYSTLFYGNENADMFSGIVINELKKLNE